MPLVFHTKIKSFNTSQTLFLLVLKVVYAIFISIPLYSSQACFRFYKFYAA